MIKALTLMLAVLALGACASNPAERLSPCVCNWTPIGGPTEEAV